ncbi:MAG TPA: hypothetical protein VHY84_14940 [Bryobacteraceae bacterium]|jgi:hypothetical protein|nr:hypothetical protein [Bryobacteraceae bacterium]
MGILRNLVLDEFSIVRGDDVQPANPGAVALFYKSTPKNQPKEKDAMAETKAPEGPKKKSKAAFIKDAVYEAIRKATTTYDSSSTYSSTSSATSTVTELPDGTGTDSDAPMVIVVSDSVEKKEVAPAPVPAADSEVISKALKAELEPLMKAVAALDGRIAVVEKTSTGSRRLDKSIGSVAQISGGDMKFPEFTKFLSARSELSNGQRLTKATLTSSGWTYGLANEEAGNFIDYIFDLSTVLKMCRTVTMPNSTYKIDKIGLGSKVLVKGTPGVDPGDTVSLSGPSQVLLTAQEMLAIVAIGDDTLEDNIEGEAFVQHLLGMIGRSAANEIETAAMLADTAVADTGILDRWDGWYKLAKANGAHVIEGMADTDRYWAGAAPPGKKMTKLLKALPIKYRQDVTQMRAILANDLNLDYVDTIAAIAIPDAIKAITGAVDLPIRNVPVAKMPNMSTTQAFTYSSTDYTDGTFVMLTNLQNLIFGIHREIKIEPFREPRLRRTSYILSMRATAAIENADAIAIYDHAKVQA